MYKWTLFLNVILRKDEEGVIDMTLLALFFSADLLTQNRKAFLTVNRLLLKANTLSLEQGFTRSGLKYYIG